MSVIARLETENARLRELYENVTGNRERFGWTINHLLECEESLRIAESELQGAGEALRKLARIHHNTIKPSRLHDPHNRDWTECECKSCRLAQPFREG